MVLSIRRVVGAIHETRTLEAVAHPQCPNFTFISMQFCVTFLRLLDPCLCYFDDYSQAKDYCSSYLLSEHSH